MIYPLGNQTLQVFVLACGALLTTQILWASGIILSCPWTLSRRTIDDILRVIIFAINTESFLDLPISHLDYIEE